MHHTMREQQVLRVAKLYQPKPRITLAGAFWVGYVLTIVVGAYLAADLVTRWFS
jgi:hypothetical protein